MKIKIYGFTWNPTPIGHTEAFLEYVKDQNKVEIQAANLIRPEDDYHRVVNAAKFEDNLWCGFILTIKNARKFIRSNRTDTGFRVSSAEIEGEEGRITEINFFIYNSNNGAGLYQYYHNSAKLTTLNGTFISKYKNYLHTTGINKGKLNATSYFTPQDFQERVLGLAAVHHTEFELSTIEIPDRAGVPAGDYVKRQRIKVFYDPQMQSSVLLRRDINSFLKQEGDNIKRFFLKGKDQQGHEVYYSIADDPSIFNEYEFDDFVVELDVDGNIEKALINCQNVIDLVHLSKQDNVRTFFYKDVQE